MSNHGMSSKRKRLKRERLFARDGGACFWCGKALNHRTATIDHLHPIRDGGCNHDSNLVLSCRKCNLKREKMPQKKAFESK